MTASIQLVNEELLLCYVRGLSFDLMLLWKDLLALLVQIYN